MSLGEEPGPNEDSDGGRNWRDAGGKRDRENSVTISDTAAAATTAIAAVDALETQATTKTTAAAVATTKSPATKVTKTSSRAQAAA